MPIINRVNLMQMIKPLHVDDESLFSFRFADDEDPTDRRRPDRGSLAFSVALNDLRKFEKKISHIDITMNTTTATQMTLVVACVCPIPLTCSFPSLIVPCACTPGVSSCSMPSEEMVACPHSGLKRYKHHYYSQDQITANDH